jgi:hypothetical protein
MQAEVIRALGEWVTKSVTPDIPDASSVFHGQTAPPITIPKYLERWDDALLQLYQIAGRSSPTLPYVVMTTAAVYVHRATVKFPLTPLTVHRVVAAAMSLAFKMWVAFDQVGRHLAKIGGLKSGELRRLEVALMNRLDHRMLVTGPGPWPEPVGGAVEWPT